MRLFIAIPISEEIRENIGKFQEELKSVYNKKVRWVVPENIHLTLKFLGEVDPDKIKIIYGIMLESIRDINKFSIEIKGAGVFPDKTRPRVLWVGCIDTSGYISSIKNNLDKGLKSLKFKKEKRKLVPHLTIGRVRNFKGRLDVLPEEVELGKLEVCRIQLIESKLTSKGAEYKIVKDVTF